ncbi:NUDIX hydrolase [Actinocrinis puniceicyclus]|uniref:NUDIX hydrolase n=1 Tax=Actinocrinis puniceicyclus TaxID=977794 RepID=A0A8J8BE15_9ACTN|nr:NUDIX hydrolase [Actinocrinis puniceicyclus]MBS2963339.1 NUDIX hydrolase [Actinocrinis puniceicyclus]
MQQTEANHNPSSRYLGGAFAFLFDDKGRFLLLGERPDTRKYMWDLPGGTLTDEEPPVEALHREVFEETGLRLRLLSPLCWLKWDRHRSGAPILVAFYVAHVVAPDDVRLSEEHTEYRWVTMEEFEYERLAVSAEEEIVRECFALYRQCQCTDR